MFKNLYLINNFLQITKEELSTALIGILVVVLFIIGLGLFVYFGNKKDIAKQKVIDDMLAKDPDLKVEYRYFIDLRNRNDEKTRQLITRSIITLAVYYAIFNIGASLLVEFFTNKYCADNNIARGVLQSSSELYDEEIYKAFTNQYEVLLELIIYGMLFVGVCITSLPFIIKDFKEINKKTFLYGLLGLAFIFGVSIVCSIIISTIGFTNEASNEESIIEMFTSSLTNGILLSIVTVIFAPIVEELVFRKAIFNLIGNKTRLCLVISSLIFGGLHVVSPVLTELMGLFEGSSNLYTLSSELVYLITYTSMGLALGITYIKGKRNIFTSIFTHMLNNAISLIITLFSIYFFNLF